MIMNYLKQGLQLANLSDWQQQACPAITSPLIWWMVAKWFFHRFQSPNDILHTQNANNKHQNIEGSGGGRKLHKCMKQGGQSLVVHGLTSLSGG